MISKNQPKSKKILFIVGFIILIIAILFFSYFAVIFQEGNPWSQLKGIAQLNFTSKNIVKLTDKEDKYITKSKNGSDIIKEYIKNKGYNFTEQMGSAYFFESLAGGPIIVTHKYYSRFYSLWKILENTNLENIKNNDIKNNFWITATNNNMIFQYPKELLTTYISEVEWPPQVKIESKEFTCISFGNEIQESGKTEPRLINNHQYCLTKQSEGSAGSVYTTYKYIFPKDNKIGIITFTLRFVQCQNYDEPKASECENEQSTFDIDDLVDKIAQSIEIEENKLSITDELKECLLKSDMISHERCTELLATIKNFDDCAEAGFFIMGSNPPQCTTPDGRNFIGEINEY